MEEDTGRVGLKGICMDPESIGVPAVWMLYVIADVVFVLLYYVARYRRHVVADNISRSFPEKARKSAKR